MFRAAPASSANALFDLLDPAQSKGADTLCSMLAKLKALWKVKRAGFERITPKSPRCTAPTHSPMHSTGSDGWTAAYRQLCFSVSHSAATPGYCGHRRCDYLKPESWRIHFLARAQGDLTPSVSLRAHGAIRPHPVASMAIRAGSAISALGSSEGAMIAA